jgi:transposase
MSKYSNEFKLKVVKYCIEESHSKYDAAMKYNIPSPTPIDNWIRKYKEHGPEGLIKQQKSSYNGEFKQNVIEYMHINHLSATETAIHFRIQASAVLKWERIYYEE